MQAIKEFILNYIWTPLTSIGVNDVIDILFVAIVLFYALRFIRNRRAGKLIIGVMFLLILLIVARIAGLVTVNYVLSNFFEVGVIALIIIFQPELRSALEKVGSEPGKRIKLIRDKTDALDKEKMIFEICTAVVQMSKEKTGALIVIERQTKLGEHINSGMVVNADLSAQMIENIFFKNAPLHDGAMVIRDYRIYAAGCFLPLSQNPAIKALGTRHHAALGVSEVSDALVIVVSEQTGTISVALDGSLERNMDYVSLRQFLTRELHADAATHGKTSKKNAKKNKKNSGGTDAAGSAED